MKRTFKNGLDRMLAVILAFTLMIAVFTVFPTRAHGNAAKTISKISISNSLFHTVVDHGSAIPFMFDPVSIEEDGFNYIWNWSYADKEPNEEEDNKFDKADTYYARFYIEAADGYIFDGSITSVIINGAVCSGEFYMNDYRTEISLIVPVTVINPVAEVEALIAAIPDPFTLSGLNAYNKAAEAFAALTKEQAKLVSNASKLSDAKEALAKILKEEAEKQAADKKEAELVITQIKIIPDNITLDDKAGIVSARISYGNLTSDQKALIPAQLLSKLYDAEVKIRELENTKYNITIEMRIIGDDGNSMRYKIETYQEKAREWIKRPDDPVKDGLHFVFFSSPDIPDFDFNNYRIDRDVYIIGYLELIKKPQTANVMINDDGTASNRAIKKADVTLGSAISADVLKQYPELFGKSIEVKPTITGGELRNSTEGDLQRSIEQLIADYNVYIVGDSTSNASGMQKDLKPDVNTAELDVNLGVYANHQDTGLKLTETSEPVEMTMALPAGTVAVSVKREHNGVSSDLLPQREGNGETDSYSVKDLTIHIYGSEFSVYTLTIYTLNTDDAGQKDDGDPVQSVTNIPVYRLFNSFTGEHFFTVNKDEKEGLLAAGYADEGVAFSTPLKSATPVYRLFNPVTGEHAYAVKEAAVSALTSAGFSREGIAWYADDRAVFLLTDPKAKVHRTHITVSSMEKEALVKAGWTEERLY